MIPPMNNIQLFYRRTLILATSLILAGLPLSLAASPLDNSGQLRSSTHAGQFEQQLITSLRDIQEQRLDGALEKLGTLIEENPKFKLAQLIYGDMLLAKAAPIAGFGNPSASNLKSEVSALKDEAQARWQHHNQHLDPDYVPSHLLALDAGIKHAVAIDLSKSRLYLYKHTAGQLELLTDYYVSFGKNGIGKMREGDKKTPIGVYHITSYLSPKELPDFYGAGAFPINYPNALDKIQGKTGYGIWLHGTPLDTYSRPPQTSDGCVSLSNIDLEAIKPLLRSGQIPVIIAESIDWVKKDQVLTLKDDFSNVIDGWRNDWQSLDPDRYLENYSRSFRSKKMDYTRWSKHKRRVNKQKQFINVELENVSIFTYPDSQDMRVVTFQQKYHSSNYRNTSYKQQYWKREGDGVWRIIYEGPAS